MKRFAAVSLTIIVIILLSSCASLSGDTGLTGVWKYTAGEETRQYAFTSDGFYAFEYYYDGLLGYAEIGTYEYDEEQIFTSFQTIDYYLEGTILTINESGYDEVYKRSSKIAKNNTSAANLRGVWVDNYNYLGFSSNGIAIAMGSAQNVSRYSVEPGSIVLDGEYDTYLIINDKLYIQDDAFFLNANSCNVFSRKAKGGEEQTSGSLLVSASPWDLVDVYDGARHYIYTFESNGTYEMISYYEGYSDTYQSGGTYRFSGNKILLSDDADLAYAIIDYIPFMFSYYWDDEESY